MIKTVVALALTFLFLGCSSKSDELTNVESKLVIGKSLNQLTLNDQFEKSHILADGTTTVIFAFSKDGAHVCNDFFVTQTPTYLADNNTVFIADVSAAPSLIRSMFILPGLKDFNHTVLLLDDKTIAAPFRKDMKIEEIVIISLNAGNITKIETITTEKELQSTIETK